MANRSSEFVLDELLCYLSNPLFQVPVLSFMENNCLIFDTSTEDSAEYRAVHEQYRQLVDALLDAFRKDSGLSHDQIIQAMKDLNAKPELRKVFHELFEQVLAMDDFPCFVHLMMNKNLELQKQALMMLTMLHGDLPNSLQQGQQDKSSGKAPAPSQQEDEEEILKAVMEQSRKEYEAQQRASQKEEEDLKAVLTISQVESQRLEAAHRAEQEKLSQALTTSLHIKDAPDSGSPAPAPASKGTPAPAKSIPAPTKSTPSPAVSSHASGGLASMGPLPALPKEPAKSSPAKPAAVPAAAAAAPSIKKTTTSSGPKPLVASHDLGPLPGAQSKASSKNAAADWLQTAQNEVKASDAHSQAVYAAAASMAGMSEAEYEKRVHFLKQQRDKLMEMKRREREKQLLSAASTQPTRPASARAARNALKQADTEAAPPTEDEKKMAMRKAIANRIKSEVMEERKG